MRTVEKLIDELKKFPNEAVCYAYEGEGCGIVVEMPGTRPFSPQGFIPCGEGVESKDEPPSELLPS